MRIGSFTLSIPTLSFSSCNLPKEHPLKDIIKRIKSILSSLIDFIKLIGEKMGLCAKKINAKKISSEEPIKFQTSLVLSSKNFINENGSCTVASVMQIYAHFPYYRMLFDPTFHPLHQRAHESDTTFQLRQQIQTTGKALIQAIRNHATEHRIAGMGAFRDLLTQYSGKQDSILHEDQIMSILMECLENQKFSAPVCKQILQWNYIEKQGNHTEEPAQLQAFANIALSAQFSPIPLQPIPHEKLDLHYPSLQATLTYQKLELVDSKGRRIAANIETAYRSPGPEVIPYNLKNFNVLYKFLENGAIVPELQLQLPTIEGTSETYHLHAFIYQYRQGHTATYIRESDSTFVYFDDVQEQPKRVSAQGLLKSLGDGISFLFYAKN